MMRTHRFMYGMIKWTLLLVWCCLGMLSHGQVLKTVEYADTIYAYTDPGFELLDGASKGDTTKIKAFLELGTDVNTVSWDAVTPLMFAAQNGHLRAVEILIDAGADLNMKPYNQIDALLGATIAGHVMVADTLILNGANVNTRSLDGLTPLMYAAAFDHYLLCDVLIFYGASINTTDNFRNSPLHFSTFYGNLEVTRLLVEKGASQEATDLNGFTPLMCAAQNGHLQVVDFLLQAGSEINKTNDYNCDPLSLAIINRFYGVADYLLQNGADPNHLISKKFNQYELARESAGREMTSLLGSYGAEPLQMFSISKFVTSFDMNLNNRDIMLGGSLGLVESVYGWKAELGYKTRPAVRSVRYAIDDQNQYQFWEKRSLIYLGAGKEFVLASPRFKEQFGAYAVANAGYTYGSFRGASQKPDDKIVFIPGAGMFYDYRALRVKLGYEYFKIANTDMSPHRITLSVGVIMNVAKRAYKLKKEPRL